MHITRAWFSRIQINIMIGCSEVGVSSQSPWPAQMRATVSIYSMYRFIQIDVSLEEDHTHMCMCMFSETDRHRKRETERHTDKASALDISTESGRKKGPAHKSSTLHQASSSPEALVNKKQQSLVLSTWLLKSKTVASAPRVPYMPGSLQPSSGHSDASGIWPIRPLHCCPMPGTLASSRYTAGAAGRGFCHPTTPQQSLFSCVQNYRGWTGGGSPRILRTLPPSGELLQKS